MTAMPIATPPGGMIAAERVGGMIAAGDGVIRALDTSVVRGRYAAVFDAGSR
jgi:hypothetical protein